MKYKAGKRRRAAEYEKFLVEWWKKNKVFERSVEERSVENSYVFYDGPPFITGMPHHGTLLSSIVKDAVPRFWTMRGKRVERRWGWDCHGLPAENFVEKQLGITDRREIGTKWSLEDYILKARESMVAHSETWEGTIDRIGRWVDFKGAYRTMDRDFMESVWWAFKTLYEAGKIYEGAKVLMYDTKFATPVSKSEVTMDNDAYQTVTDPSAYVKFRLAEAICKTGLAEATVFCETFGATSGQPELAPGTASAKQIFMIAWTTTPWTLPANMALAVNPEMEYGAYAVGDEIWVVAEKCAEKVQEVLGGEWEKVGKMKGEELVGLTYEAICDAMEAKPEKAWRVLGGDFVGSEEGTGVVHIAPAYGEDDFEICKREGIEYVDVLDEYGCYTGKVKEWLEGIGVRPNEKGEMQIWEVNKFVAKCLEEKGIVAKIEYVKHDYPFNPRSKERIMYRAVPSWFFDVGSSKELMIEQNENVRWFPGYLKEGRFKKNIEQAPDWNLSRDRFWATAMPVWKGDRGSVKVVGSYDELEELSGVRLEDYHRPWVDRVEFVVDGEKFTRVDKVLDCWFESGSMPFAQLHYPFENKEKFEQNYPADFIVEYVGQVRAWFYYVHCVNSVLASIGAFDKQPSSASASCGARSPHGECGSLALRDASLNPTTSRNRFNPFMNVITTGTLAGNDGRKMSKSLGNYTDPNELMDQYSADALRFLLLSSPVLSGEDFALTDKDVSDTARKLAMVWNVYDFFCMYAEVDQWDSGLAEAICETGLAEAICKTDSAEAAVFCETFGATSGQPELAPGESSSCAQLENPLDRWIVARLNELIVSVTEGMEEYNIPKAMAGILPFVDDLSNWFVRRSRRRFWKSEDGGDKAQAYATLYGVMVELAKVLAPFAPFLAEELWQNLAGDWDTKKSVHLLEWPVATEADEGILAEMARVREVINEGLRLRMYKDENEAQVKVRQPLAKLVYAGEELPEWGVEIVKEEVNVKAVERGEEMWVDKELTEELKREGWTRELVRMVQSARKKAGLNVDDRIRLSVDAEVPEEWREMLMSEVLAAELTKGENYAYDEIVKVDGGNVVVSLEKVG